MQGYIGEDPNNDITFCIRTMTPASYRILHMFVHILIGASELSTDVINFLQKNSQVAIDPKEYCFKHIQNDWKVLGKILNCSEENLSLLLHFILSNMTQNQQSDLRTPDQREEWETQFTRIYVTPHITNVIKTAADFRKKLDSASAAVKRNNVSAIESEIIQPDHDESRLPRLWHKIRINTFEDFRAYYSGNFVYLEFEEKLRYTKHFWPIVKFVSAKISDKLSREEALIKKSIFFLLLFFWVFFWYFFAIFLVGTFLLWE